MHQHHGLQVVLATGFATAIAGTHQDAKIIPAPAFRSHRPFLIVPYLRGAGDVLVASLPDVCPFAEQSGGCVLRRVHERARKTGPGHPIQVMRCRTHDRCFTLYPPGHAPYQRFAIERRAPDGGLLVVEGETDPVRTDFGGTVFEAGLDGKEGRAWRRCSSSEDEYDRWWGRQGRHQRLAGELLGVAAGVSAQERERVAALLGVGMLTLEEAGRDWHDGYRTRGRAITLVLRCVRRTFGRMLRLLHAGFLSRRWGRPMLWHAGRRTVETLPFPPPGTPQPP